MQPGRPAQRCQATHGDGSAACALPVNARQSPVSAQDSLIGAPSMSPGLRSRISVACHGRQYPAGSRRTLEQAQMGWPRQPLGRQPFLCAASTLSPSSKMMAALGRSPSSGPGQSPQAGPGGARRPRAADPMARARPEPRSGSGSNARASRVPGIINALATDVAAVDDASAAFLPHFPDQAVLERLARLDPAAEQVPVLLAVGLAGAENDQPGPGEADAISLVEGAAVPDGTEDRTR
jgi:hypothetical protein